MALSCSGLFGQRSGCSLRGRTSVVHTNGAKSAPLSCHEEEEKSGAVLLIGQDGGEADPAVVVDGDVQVLVACASGLARSVSVDAVAGLDDARQPLDIEVDEAARPLVLVAHDRGRRIERLEPVHAVAAKDAADGSAAQAKRVGDPPAVVAQPAKSQNLFQ